MATFDSPSLPRALALPASRPSPSSTRRTRTSTAPTTTPTPLSPRTAKASTFKASPRLLTLPRDSLPYLSSSRTSSVASSSAAASSGCSQAIHPGTLGGLPRPRSRSALPGPQRNRIWGRGGEVSSLERSTRAGGEGEEGWQGQRAACEGERYGHQHALDSRFEGCSLSLSLPLPRPR